MYALPAPGDEYRRRSRSRSRSFDRRPQQRRRSPRGGGGGGGGNNNNDPDAHLRLSLDEVLPRLVDAAMEKVGSRFLLMRLGADDVSADEVDRIFREALPASAKLAGDVTAGPVFLKLVEKLGSHQQVAVADRLRGEVAGLVSARPGAMVLRRLVEGLPEDNVARILSELRGEIQQCIENAHGTQVVQACIKRLPLESLDFVVEALGSSAERMVSHVYGSRVLRLLFEHCPDCRASLVPRVLSDVGKLARESHGVYLLKALMDTGRTEDQVQILGEVRGDVREMAKGKVSCVIVEKCFACGSSGADSSVVEARRELFEALVGPEGDFSFQQLVEDKIGGHTVQSIVRYCSLSEREVLKERADAAAVQPTTPEGAPAVAEVQKELAQADGQLAVKAPEAVMSKGSALHGDGSCKPCAWFWKPRGCQNGRHCEHCHLCPEGELKARRRVKIAVLKSQQAPGEEGENNEGEPSVEQQVQGAS